MGMPGLINEVALMISGVVDLVAISSKEQPT
jgi:hypothetical protein